MAALRLVTGIAMASRIVIGKMPIYRRMQSKERPGRVQGCQELEWLSHFFFSRIHGVWWWMGPCS